MRSSGSNWIKLTVNTCVTSNVDGPFLGCLDSKGSGQRLQHRSAVRE